MVLKFKKILIIQALFPSDLKTGEKLEDEIDPFISFHSLNTTIEIEKVTSKNEFLNLLHKIKSEILLTGDIPLLHLETHGSDDKKGMIFPNRDFLSWLELKPFLIEINIATRFNLFIVFAMCNGANFLEVLTVEDRCPCVGLLGPITTVKPEPLLATFSQFYKLLLRSNNLVEAVKGINNMNENFHKTGYFVTTAYIQFHKIVESFERDSHDKKLLAAKAKSIRKKYKKNKYKPLPSVGSIKRLIKNGLPKKVNEIGNNFLMFDLFPENKESLNEFIYLNRN